MGGYAKPQPMNSSYPASIPRKIPDVMLLERSRWLNRHKKISIAKFRSPLLPKLFPRSTAGLPKPPSWRGLAMPSTPIASRQTDRKPTGL